MFPNLLHRFLSDTDVLESSDKNWLSLMHTQQSSSPAECQTKIAPHKLVRHEMKEQCYRLSGQGLSSGFDPEHPVSFHSFYF